MSMRVYSAIDASAAMRAHCLHQWATSTTDKLLLPGKSLLYSHDKVGGLQLSLADTLLLSCCLQ